VKRAHDGERQIVPAGATGSLDARDLEQGRRMLDDNRARVFCGSAFGPPLGYFEPERHQVRDLVEQPRRGILSGSAVDCLQSLIGHASLRPHRWRDYTRTCTRAHAASRPRGILFGGVSDMRKSPWVTLAVALCLSTAAFADDAAQKVHQPPPEQLPPLRVQVEKSRVDLKAHRLELTMSRQPSKVTIKVQGDSGAILADESHDFSGSVAGGTLVFTWSPSSDEPVAKIEVFGWDAYGYYAGVAVVPWSVSIPHEELNFRTDSAEIDASERPKLEKSYVLVTETIGKHKNIGQAVLFIAGHTDTVGTNEHNFRLSLARAQSIANWFRRRGLTIPIAYEGFGKTSLLVKTADDVDEPRNRRVDYILAVDEPTLKTTGFRAGWKRVK
jgi:outer membrane protein OmpA-like peptidoglycan-associated protein